MQAEHIISHLCDFHTLNGRRLSVSVARGAQDGGLSLLSAGAIAVLQPCMALGARRHQAAPRAFNDRVNFGYLGLTLRQLPPSHHKFCNLMALHEVSVDVKVKVCHSGQ